MTMTDNKCEVCDDRTPVAVCSIPGMPVSVAYCRECAEAGASPYWAIVANTAMIGGMDHAAPWWDAEVENTLAHLKKTRAQFDVDVAKEIIDQRESEDKYFAEQEAKDREKFEAMLRAEGTATPEYDGDGSVYMNPDIHIRWQEFIANGARTPEEIRSDELTNSFVVAVQGPMAQEPLPPCAHCGDAPLALPPEPVAWESRFLDESNGPGEWSQWERVLPRNIHTDTVADRVREFQSYIDRGYKYELRALYTHPPVPAAQPVERAGDR